MTATEDELAIRRVLAEYCQFLDDGDFASVLAGFTEDGRLVLGSRTYDGPEAVRHFFEKAQAPGLRGKHLTTNVIVDLDGDRASVRSDYVFYRYEGAVFTPMGAGRYVDDLVRTEHGWRIGSRSIITLQPHAA